MAQLKVVDEMVSENKIKIEEIKPSSIKLISLYTTKQLKVSSANNNNSNVWHIFAY